MRPSQNSGSTEALRQIYRDQIQLVCQTAPPDFRIYVQYVEKHLDSLISDNHPRVLSHRPMTRNDIVVDPETLALISTTNWSQLVPAPFGETLCLLDQVLGWESPTGWCWLPFHQKLRQHFWGVFERHAGKLSPGQKELIQAARLMGFIFRFGPGRTRGRQADNYGILGDIFHTLS